MSKKGDSLGDRMKRYENCYRLYLTRRTPVLIRLDGRAFHTLTKSCEKPFDHELIYAMNMAATAVANDMQGCVAFYHQSDEVTFFLRDYQSLVSEAWFDYNKSKIESVSASVMTAHFNAGFKKFDKLAYFDSRSFNIPKEEVVNAFLWRVRDWQRNSVTMVASEHFSHKELHGKNMTDRLDMLYEKGVEYHKLDHHLRYGSLWISDGSNRWMRPEFEGSWNGLNEYLEQFL